MEKWRDVKCEKRNIEYILSIGKLKERCGTRDRKRANKIQKDRKEEKKVVVKRRDTNKRERDKREDQY